MKLLRNKNWMNMTILCMVLLTPIIDVFTAYFIRAEVDIPFTNIIRAVFLAVVVLYTFSLKQVLNRKYFITYCALLAVYVALFIVQFYDAGFSVLFNESKEILRYYYFPLILCSLFLLWRSTSFYIHPVTLTLVMLMYLLVLGASQVLDLSYNGYTQGKVGNIGLFYSLNEVGAILSLLYPIALLHIHRIRKWWLDILFIAVVGVILLSLGSKVPIAVYGLVSACYVFMILYKLYKGNQKKYVYIIGGSLIVVGVCSLAYITTTNFYQNIILHLEFLEIYNVSDLFTYKGLNEFIFSRRLDFMGDEWYLFSQQSVSVQLLGMGSFQNIEGVYVVRKMVEMDVMDIFFKYGYIGSILYFVPIGVVGTCIWRSAVEPRFKMDALVYKSSIVLICIVACISGHVFSAPSVSLLLCVLFILLMQTKRRAYEKSNVYI